MQHPSLSSQKSRSTDNTPAELVASDAFFGNDSEVTSLHSEIAAVRELSRLLTDQSHALRRFLDLALSVTAAGSAGVSLIDGATELAPLRWSAISGAMSSHEGVVTPREFSTCGLCLDRAQPLLMHRPQRAFPYLAELTPSIAQLLVVPLSAHGVDIGTLWLAHHDSAAHFCCDDVLVVERLALHLKAALQQCSRSMEHRRALAGRDNLVRDAHHRVTNTLQLAASLLRLGAQSDNALRAGSGRLEVLAKIHGLLAIGAEDSVELSPLLRAIVDAANEGLSSSARDVRVRLETERFTLSGDHAIPLVLLANEAVTNACNHAFPNAAKGIVRVAVKMEGERLFVMRITDDGVGMSEQRADGLGLRLIRNLAEQLRALVVFEAPANGSGTSIVVRFHIGPDWLKPHAAAAPACAVLA